MTPIGRLGTFIGMDRRTGGEAGGAPVGVVVVHAPSGRFLGPGCMLVERSDAVPFDCIEIAEQFLVRHASEPCYDVVSLTERLVA